MTQLRNRRWIAISALMLATLACTCGTLAQLTPTLPPPATATQITPPAATATQVTPPAATATPVMPTATEPLPTNTLVPTITDSPTATATTSPDPTITAPPPTATPGPSPTPDLVTLDKTRQQRRIFNNLWTIIHNMYVYSDYNGVDWQAVHDQYQPQIEAGLDTQTFYNLMQAMIDELGDEHSHFLSPQQVDREAVQAAADNDYVGIGVLLVAQPEKDRIVVLTIFPDSPAARAGLQPHDSILLADEQAVLSEQGEIRSDILRGPEGSSVRLQVQTPGEAPREVVIVRQAIPGGSPLYSRLLPTADGNGILYIIVPDFIDTTMPDRIETILREHTAAGPLDGIIIDNRINSGGYNTVLRRMLGFFTSGEQGQFVNRNGSNRTLFITPDDINGTQQVPLVVIVGKRTASYGEVFSGVLQDSGRATLVGSITNGNIETLYPYDFEDGSRAYIAQETFLPAVSGADWEREGVIPDHIVEAEWGDVNFDNDPTLAVALMVLGYN